MSLKSSPFATCKSSKPIQQGLYYHPTFVFQQQDEETSLVFFDLDKQEQLQVSVTNDIKRYKYSQTVSAQNIIERFTVHESHVFIMCTYWTCRYSHKGELLNAIPFHFQSKKRTVYACSDFLLVLCVDGNLHIFTANLQHVLHWKVQLTPSSIHVDGLDIFLVYPKYLLKIVFNRTEQFTILYIPRNKAAPIPSKLLRPCDVFPMADKILEPDLPFRAYMFEVSKDTRVHILWKENSGPVNDRVNKLLLKSSKNGYTPYFGPVNIACGALKTTATEWPLHIPYEVTGDAVLMMEKKVEGVWHFTDFDPKAFLSLMK